MATVEKIRSVLIDKIRSISNKDFLKALDILISANVAEPNVVTLTDAQKALLQMSEEDIEKGRLISQKAMDKRNLEWLNAM